eukprot:403364844
MFGEKCLIEDILNLQKGLCFGYILPQRGQFYDRGVRRINILVVTMGNVQCTRPGANCKLVEIKVKINSRLRQQQDDMRALAQIYYGSTLLHIYQIAS